jgi:hypothetical protein
MLAFRVETPADMSVAPDGRNVTIVNEQGKAAAATWPASTN